jgi:AcrR family transcriptional regulator
VTNFLRGESTKATNRSDPRPLHQVIVDVTRKLLVERGDPDKVSISEICRRAQCTPPSIYHYFPTKQILMHAASLVGFREFNLHLDTLAAKAKTGFDDIMLRMHAYLDWGLDNPAEYRVMFRRQVVLNPSVFRTRNPEVPQLHLNAILAIGDDGIRNEPEQPISAGLIPVHNAIVRAQEEGSIPDTVDGPTMTLLVWAQVHGLTMLGISNPGLSRDLLHETLDLLPLLSTQQTS